MPPRVQTKEKPALLTTEVQIYSGILTVDVNGLGGLISVACAGRCGSLIHFHRADVCMRPFVVPLLATAIAFPQAAPPLTAVKPTRIAAAQSDAQKPPVTATKTRDTYAIGPAGGITLKLEERGTFSRNSAGDEASHLKVISDGQAGPGSRVISLRTEGKSYVIDDASQQYRVVPWPEGPALTDEAERQSKSGATRTIDGIKCMAVPVRDSAGKIVGKNWVSPDYGITVRSEMDVWNPQKDTVVGLVVEELTQIRIGATPDAGTFTIPPGYKQVSGRGPR